MATTTPSLSVKTPPATTSGVHGFVSQTTPRPQQKDTVNVSYHDDDAQVQSR